MWRSYGGSRGGLAPPGIGAPRRGRYGDGSPYGDLDRAPSRASLGGRPLSALLLSRPLFSRPLFRFRRPSAPGGARTESAPRMSPADHAWEESVLARGELDRVLRAAGVPLALGTPDDSQATPLVSLGHATPLQLRRLSALVRTGLREVYLTRARLRAALWGHGLQLPELAVGEGMVHLGSVDLDTASALLHLLGSAPATPDRLPRDLSGIPRDQGAVDRPWPVPGVGSGTEPGPGGLDPADLPEPEAAAGEPGPVPGRGAPDEPWEEGCLDDGQLLAERLAHAVERLSGHRPRVRLQPDCPRCARGHAVDLGSWPAPTASAVAHALESGLTGAGQGVGEPDGS
ncbi:hypothetical protein [Streptomyces sp. NPDC005438]|uniref:hypothetical protein n=1 Tax=Streptomyces sp. NPDC005438 TaxID=3156880 RepID=UPI0033BA0C6F